ncbi:hypothetical protein PRIPAC_90538, partial [Pristionchus pacificus]
SYSRDFMMQIRDIEPVLDTSSFTYFSEHDFRIFENTDQIYYRETVLHIGGYKVGSKIMISPEIAMTYDQSYRNNTSSLNEDAIENARRRNR